MECKDERDILLKVCKTIFNNFRIQKRTEFLRMKRLDPHIVVYVLMLLGNEQQ